MSKITFRADDDLVNQLEEFDASKSEILREALREYLERHTDLSETPASGAATGRAATGGAATGGAPEDRFDALVAERVDALVADNLGGAGESQDINVNITLDGVEGAYGADSADAVVEDQPADSHTATDETQASMESKTATDGDTDASELSCHQCGEEIAASHVYCPNCGEKSSGRVYCECGDELRSDWAFCPSCGTRTPAADVLEGS